MKSVAERRIAELESELATVIKERDEARKQLELAHVDGLIELGNAGDALLRLDDALLRLEEVTNERDELEALFDMQWQADMRAISMWREGHPERKLRGPDRTGMVVWLLERLEAVEGAESETPA